ncbi:MAG: hypothetical protein RBG13Loki_2542 [Promethearchaeota archaeon CR_4]|nr:MAG: hypothetical protein RBG13Loki_2542 [Candidatus Lokiarchaeota archaeon CR_4]
MVVSVERTWEGIKLKASLQTLRDSYLFFLTDQNEFGIGTIIAGVPAIKDSLITNPSSTALIGTRDLNISKIITKNLCKKLEKPIISFIDLKTTMPEIKLGKYIVEILESLLQEHKKNK